MYSNGEYTALATVLHSQNSAVWIRLLATLSTPQELLFPLLFFFFNFCRKNFISTTWLDKNKATLGFEGFMTQTTGIIVSYSLNQNNFYKKNVPELKSFSI